jgi:hypothetical protein
MSRLDLTRELNLRRWARLNYIAPDERPGTWHPIVLNEMQNQDIEQAQLAAPNSVAARYVPLMPSAGWGEPGGEFCSL